MTNTCQDEIARRRCEIRILISIKEANHGYSVLATETNVESGGRPKAKEHLRYPKRV
jgi:hypothetical protein